jgi:hypothetical protein
VLAGVFQEWCDKQMEFVLEHGKPERTQAMKAGSDRHAQLEQEVIFASSKRIAVSCYLSSMCYNVPHYWLVVPSFTEAAMQQ